MKRIFAIIVILICLITACKKDMARQNLGNQNSSQKILVAGDTSSFKQSVLQRTWEKLDTSNYAVTIIGLNDLSAEDIKAYKVVLLVNTVWANRLDERVDAFLNKNTGDQKIIVFTSVGGEDYQPKLSFDTITSASYPDRIEQRSDELVKLIKSKMATN